MDNDGPAIIDGARFDGLEGFYDEVTAVLFDGRPWGRNLDALADALDPERPLRWVHAGRSRAQLGHEETARWLAEKLTRVHPDNHERWALRLAAARRGEGDTLFDVLVQLMRERGAQLELED